MKSKKRALAVARQIRMCPPAELCSDPAHSDKCAAHRRVCPLCADPENALDEFRTAAQAVLNCTAEAGGEDPNAPAAPGQLRGVSNDLAGWRGSHYYRPPVVLITDRCEHLQDSVRVVQTWVDPVLAGPGDLVLDAGDSPLGAMMIECWNVYTLRTADLGPLLGELEADVVAAVHRLQADFSAHPAWAPLPLPIRDENDARVFFRRMEVEVGYVFAAASAAAVLEGIESGAAGAEADVGDLQQRLAWMVPGLEWSVPPQNEDEVFLLAGFPAEQMPLAAETRPARRFYAKRVVRKNEKIAEFRCVEAEFFQDDSVDGVLTVSGRVSEIPADADTLTLIIRMRLPDNTLLEPADVRWDEEAGVFYAAFEPDPGPEARLEAVFVINFWKDR